MGTIIDLQVGGLMIDGSKNHMGIDYGPLFQLEDLKLRKADQRRCKFYTEQEHPLYGKAHAAYVRPLALVLPRLDLMGYSLEGARKEYRRATKEAADTERMLKMTATNYLSFDEFIDLVRMHPLATLNDQTEFDDHEKAKGKLQAIAPILSRIPQENSDGYGYWSERSYFGSSVAILNPYSMLQVFGAAPENLDAEVVWQFGPLVHSGWEKFNSFRAGVRRKSTILVATEGSTDSRIIKHALELFRPEILDFFHFVDVNESHPFWGTGNLVKFAQGLIRIDIHNAVLFVLDNDAEGRDALRRLNELQIPDNIRAMVLPDLDALKSFPARGPEGVSLADINGKAASIELYLDLSFPKNKPPPRVLWSNFKTEVNAWQGSLEHKETYMRAFLSQTPETIYSNGYDSRKLEMVLTALIAEAVKLTASAGRKGV